MPSLDNFFKVPPKKPASKPSVKKVAKKSARKKKSVQDEEDADEEEVKTQSPDSIKSRSFVKYQLLCQSKACKYKRIVVKPVLETKDLICPKCGEKMSKKEV